MPNKGRSRRPQSRRQKKKKTIEVKALTPLDHFPPGVMKLMLSFLDKFEGIDMFSLFRHRFKDFTDLARHCSSPVWSPEVWSAAVVPIAEHKNLPRRSQYLPHWTNRWDDHTAGWNTVFMARLDHQRIEYLIDGVLHGLSREIKVVDGETRCIKAEWYDRHNRTCWRYVAGDTVSEVSCSHRDHGSECPLKVLKVG